MKNVGPDWSELFSYRSGIHKRYDAVWDIPLVKKRSHLMRSILKDNMDILEIGAGARGLKDEIERMGVRHSYKSMDIDRSYEHDFYDIDDIRGEFDAIVMFEVIEHLSLEEGVKTLRKLREFLRDGGMIILSTPNIFNPSRFMRDSTHKTFYGYDELGGLLTMTGFEVKQLFRSYNDAFHRYVLKVYLLGFLFRFLSIDYAYSIFVIAEKR